MKPSQLGVLKFLLLLTCSVLAPTSTLGQNPTRLAQYITAAETAINQGRPRDALDAYTQSLPLASQLFGPGSIQVAAIQFSRGSLHRDLAEYDRAEPMLLQAASLYARNRDVEGEAEANILLGQIYTNTGRFDQANASFLAAQQIFERNYGPSSFQVAVILNNRATVLKEQGIYSEIEPLYRRSLKILSGRSEHRTHYAATLMNYGAYWMTQNEYARAEQAFLEALTIQRQLGDALEVAKVTANLGSLYLNLGLYEKALTQLRAAIAIFQAKQESDHPDQARVHSNLGIIATIQKRYPEAQQHLQEALRIRQKRLGINHPDVGHTQRALAKLWIEQKRFTEAELLLTEAKRVRQEGLGDEHPFVADAVADLAYLAHSQGDREKARLLYDDAQTRIERSLSRNHPAYAFSLRQLAGLDALDKEWGRAAERIDESRRISLAYVAKVLPALSETEQLTYLKENDQPEQRLGLSLALKQPSDQRIVEASAGWVLNGKGLTRQALAQRALLARDTANPATQEIARQLQTVRKRLSELFFGTKPISEQQELADQLAWDEQKYARQLAQFNGRATDGGGWTELTDVRSALQEGELLIEIVHFEAMEFSGAADEARREGVAHYLAWLIPPAGDLPVSLVNLGPAEPIDRLIESARTALQQAPVEIVSLGEEEAEVNLRTNLVSLQQSILAPLEPLITATQATKLLLSPDAGLWLVPWAALPVGENEYLVERYDISYLVSGRDLIASDDESTLGQPIVMANPNYDLSPAEADQAARKIFGNDTSERSAPALTAGPSMLGRVGRLPGTEVEAAAVMPKIGELAGQPPQLYSDRWALELVFKQVHRPEILMLSTHGFFLPSQATESSGIDAAGGQVNPLIRCGLLLTGCNERAADSRIDDGVLTGLEIVSTDLRGTRLVVLSACETGLGEVHSGEGVAGLKQAFQLAGAQSVVATLWQIPDKESVQVVTEFFDSMTAGQPTGMALRSAQRSVIDARRNAYNAAHPFFWAAWTVTGRQ
ncbi:CHAT domain-containing tetratricopeptide repeat protein [Neorhodopirellula pilleata]|uniref:CHAT domain protein n=1 Tax=Neorhodopirellula pilleata TaxID=2714738 RepID=A0A5C6AHE4_9BACT|nr:CHAT domain-containing protein [Neorhodopirellula pilleata]TWT98877.1 CHAT domain protein [Neorhodopirellula pilleata]